jgi:general stress protein YciG
MPNKPGNDDRNHGASSSNDASRSNSNDDMSNESRDANRSNRGFASMDRGKQREIASKGGRAAHAKGTAHEFDSGEAREAGRKGGVAVSRNREHMAAIGRRGGEARGHARARAGVGAQTNTVGSNSSEGSYQNSRAASDRQVNLPSQNDGAGNSQNQRGQGQGSNANSNSINQDRRPGHESYGNR